MITFSTNPNIPDTASASYTSSLSSSSSSYLGHQVAVLNGVNAALQAFSIPSLFSTMAFGPSVIGEAMLSSTIGPNVLSNTNSETASDIQSAPAFCTTSSSSVQSSSSPSSEERSTIKEKSKIIDPVKRERKRQKDREAQRRARQKVVAMKKQFQEMLKSNMKEGEEASIRSEISVNPITAQPVVTVAAPTNLEPISVAISTADSESSSSSAASKSKIKERTSSPSSTSKRERNRTAVQEYRSRKKEITEMAKRIQVLEKQKRELENDNARHIIEKQKLVVERAALIDSNARHVIEKEQLVLERVELIDRNAKLVAEAELYASQAVENFGHL